MLKRSAPARIRLPSRSPKHSRGMRHRATSSESATTSYGAAVTRRLQTMGIRYRPITPRSPWQNGHVERADRLDPARVPRPCRGVGGKGTPVICWRITRPTTTGCVHTLRSTRMLRSIDLSRQLGLSHQSLGSAVSTGTTFGWLNRKAQVFPMAEPEGVCKWHRLDDRILAELPEW